MLRDLMHICMSRASGFFPFMIWKNELRYLCSPLHHAGPFLFCGVRRRVTRCARPSQAQGYVYKPAWWVYVRIHGPCVKEYHTSNPTRNRKAPKTMKSLWKVKSRSYIACVCIPNPNNGVTYWIFHKILKPRTTYIFQVKARRQCTIDDGAEDTMKVGDEIFLGVYVFLDWFKL